MPNDRRSPEPPTPAAAINVFKGASGGVVEVDDVVESFGCTSEAAREVLKTLEEQGQIEPVSQFKDDAWHLAGEEVTHEPWDDRSVAEQGNMVSSHEAGSNAGGGF